jgi:uncharacterized membrane protein YfcA
LEVLIIPIVVLVGSVLTFFSGFGLGTILLPAFCAFFPIEVAVFATAIVHFFNSLFKVIFVFKEINYSLLTRFAPTAILFAFLGGFVLSYLDSFTTEMKYDFFVFQNTITPLKIIIGFTMIGFAFIEFFYKKQSFQTTPTRLLIGGALSGFFGGLSGHQGAFRSMFLSKANVTKEEFVATSSAIGFLIDISRLITYLMTLSLVKTSEIISNPVLLISIIVAFTGSYLGSKLLAKTTIGSIQKTVAIFLLLFGVLICFGFL